MTPLRRIYAERSRSIECKSVYSMVLLMPAGGFDDAFHKLVPVSVLLLWYTLLHAPAQRKKSHGCQLEDLIRFRYYIP
jgi:hypothetical protein